MVVRYHWICGCNQRAMLKTVRFFRQKKTKGKWPIITWNSLGNVRRSWCCLSPANGNNISSGMRMKQVDQGPVTRPLAQAWAWLVVEHAHGQMGVFSPGSTEIFDTAEVRPSASWWDWRRAEVEFGGGEQPTLQELGRPCYYRRLYHILSPWNSIRFWWC